MQPIFNDRRDAGASLARHLVQYACDPAPVILALPRGGVPVGFEVAVRFGALLDVCVVRKLGVPGREERALGAIAGDGTVMLDAETIDTLQLSEQTVQRVAAKEARELARRQKAYRGERHAARIDGRTVFLVDDGLATGASFRAAIAATRRKQPHKIVVAVPVGAPEACGELRALADEVVCLHAPPLFNSVSPYYRDFMEVSDLDVRKLLAEAQLRFTRTTLPG